LPLCLQFRSEKTSRSDNVLLIVFIARLALQLTFVLLY
jgi:hypothetical protein